MISSAKIKPNLVSRPAMCNLCLPLKVPLLSVSLLMSLLLLLLLLSLQILVMFSFRPILLGQLPRLLGEHITREIKTLRIFVAASVAIYLNGQSTVGRQRGLV